MSLPAKFPRRSILCYVTDRHALAANTSKPYDALLESVAAASAAGIDWIQIREKDLTGEEISALTNAAIAKIKQLTQQGTNSTEIIVNDRLDAALANHAHGVHLGGNSMPTKKVCDWLKVNKNNHEATEQDNFQIGVSCHSLDEAFTAEKSGATYIFFGPIFATPAKEQFGPPQGLTRLTEVCNAIKIPVLAIGGITTENAHACLSAGAAGLAAIRLFQNQFDLDRVIYKLRAVELT